MLNKCKYLLVEMKKKKRKVICKKDDVNYIKCFKNVIKNTIKFMKYTPCECSNYKSFKKWRFYHEL